MTKLTTEHIVPYPFQMIPTLEGNVNGGLPAVLAMEFERNRSRTDRTLRIVSTDKESKTFPDHRTEVIRVDLEMSRMPFMQWFSHDWSILHANAHTFVGHPKSVLEMMYSAGGAHAIGSLERMIEHTEAFPTAQDKIEGFRMAFTNVLTKLAVPQQTPVTGFVERYVNWQDPHLFFVQTVPEVADRFHEAGFFQTGHLHTSIPPSPVLVKSTWGQKVLSGLCKLDRLFVHTAQAAHNLRQQLEWTAPKGANIPEVQLFNLGIDRPLIDSMLAETNDDNWHEKVGFEKLDAQQRTFLNEIVRTKGKLDMHRFLCIDRADPGKGLVIYLEAIDTFLNNMTPAERQKYRFFGCHDLINANVQPANTIDVKEQYVKVVQQMYAALQLKFPGIVHICAGLPKYGVLFAADDCYPVTSASDDGLNLACQEMAYINAVRSRSRMPIIAQGAGFAKEAIRRGFSRLVPFPEAGSAIGMLTAMHEAVDASRYHPRTANVMNALLVKECIMTRGDTVVVDKTYKGLSPDEY